MTGFFKVETQAGEYDGKRHSCLSCGLYRNCHTPKMTPVGEKIYPILHMGEAPGRTEDKKGEQLIGKAGKYYNGITKRETGISIHDGLKENACQCRPVDNETPTGDQIAACRPRVFDTIKKFKPHLIYILGGSPLESYFGARIKSVGAISKWRGHIIPDYDYNCWVAPVFHPSYILRMKNKLEVYELTFKEDIKNAFSYLEKPLPPKIDIDKSVLILNSQKEISYWLRRISSEKPPLLAFDYETTGLKPDAPGHWIHCVSLCWEPDFAIAFSTLDWINRNERLFLKILADPEIGKTAQNMKFEDKWTNTIFKSPVNNWVFDPMVGNHVGDNRAGITGLKFQARMRYGIWDYDSTISEYLNNKAGNTGANGFNKIHKAPKDKLHKYCAIDSLIEYHLAKDVMEEIL